MTDLAEAIAADARLYMLKELASQADGRLNAILLQRMLNSRYGVNRSREWIETQINKLVELGAAELASAGFVVAQIARPGRDHLAGRSVIAGITPPHEVE